MKALEEAYNEICDALDAAWDTPESEAFKSALHRLTLLAEFGSVDAAEALAEIRALSWMHQDPSAAYFWYYIALSQQGYSVDFDDQNNMPPYYCGPVGDFRNEAMVSDLVTMLGFSQAKELDARAAEWLSSRKR